MTRLDDIYRTSLALLTDLYQLTMAAGYWRLGRHDYEAVFHLSFRKHPFQGGYTVAAGLHAAADFLESFQFRQEDLDYMADLVGADDRPLFPQQFLDFLGTMRLSCDVDAMPEGTVAFPHEPLVRVRGPLLECQLLETPLLTLINFPTLIATKAARVCHAAGHEPVLEFGLRRAQGIDGGLSASRAAYVGGCESTSNVLAGRLYGIPVRGTHAHSWIMSFDDELEAFEAYADAMPNNAIFLVDTYDTLRGVRHAIEAGRRLRERGYPMLGIRLDSGDLAYLSIEARKMLDEAGFHDTRILATGDLDERLISSLKVQGAKIAVWGVGTKLATAFDEPALGGIYKLSAIRKPGGEWQRKLKLSEQTAKISTPGILQVRRFRSESRFVADMIYDELLGVPDGRIVDPTDPTRQRRIDPGLDSEDLLIPVLRGGRRVYESPPLEAIRARTLDQLAHLHPTIRRELNPHLYPAGLEQGLHKLKMQMILEARGAAL